MDTSPSHSNSNLSEGTYSYTTNSTSFGQDTDAKLLREKYKQSNNKVYHDFYKTKVCSLYSLGKDCPFAHTTDELRDKPNLFKTKLCDAFVQGQCTKGEECSFAHGEEELRSTPDLFKTAICNLWTQGKCTAGDSCRFAHGYDDLRPAPSHRKFKKRNFEKKPYQQTQNYQQNQYYNNQYNNNQYPYSPQVFNYPMYSMQVMPTNMQTPYMMNQPFGYNPGVNPSMRNH